MSITPAIEHRDGATVAPLRAAEYVRMSTEHQQYSTVNQAAKIREYAMRRAIEIVRTYSDEGKSGLRIDGRAGLQQLIQDVQSGTADFSLVLVYDISRWGRFQDADESAYYEYICRRAGIHVAYCAEQFENDGSPVSTIVKGVKRAMAGEYSRELSAKVFAGQCRLVELGFRQGGAPGYGLRRLLIDQHGLAKTSLARGEYKSLQTDRVILTPGPSAEIDTVLQIYRWFAERGLSEAAIAGRLNTAGVRTPLERDWSRATVHEVLTNEKYIGCNIYNRTSFKLKKMRVTNTPEMWIRKDQAFEGIVPRDLFFTVQGIIRARARRLSDVDLIERLRRLYERRGFLSGFVINETEDMPSTSVYALRFGSLLHAYQLVGFTPGRDYRYVEINRYLRQLHPGILAETTAQIAALGGAVFAEPDTDLLDVNHEFRVSIVLSRCQSTRCGTRFWRVRLDTGLHPDLTVAIRLDPQNQAAQDYYLLPHVHFGAGAVQLAERNAIELESFHFDSLQYFYGMAERYALRRAA